MNDMNIDDFTAQYPENEWLEDMECNGKSYTRLSNGLDEGSEHESEWFDLDTGVMQEGRPD